MKSFQITVDIQAPPQTVWSVISDAESWPQWTPTVTSIKRLTPDPVGVGTRVIIRQPKLPPAEWRMTEFNEGRGFVWITGGMGVKVTANHTVEPIPQGSRVKLSIHFSGLFGGLAAYFTKNLNHDYLALEAKGLKQRCESFN